MTVGPALSASLNAIGNVMAEAHDPWWVIASAAVALHGADAGRVADVDVLLGAADARRILPAIGIELRRGSPHAAFRSGIFGTWTGTALPVEFMADFQHRSRDAWVPVRPATRQTVVVAGTAVFVPARVELQAMLVAFGRPKDMERARSLAVVMSSLSRSTIPIGKSRAGVHCRAATCGRMSASKGIRTASVSPPPAPPAVFR